MDISHSTMPNGEFYLSGINIKEIGEHGLSASDIDICLPLNKKLVQERLLKFIYEFHLLVSRNKLLLL